MSISCWGTSWLTSWGSSWAERNSIAQADPGGGYIYLFPNPPEKQRNRSTPIEIEEIVATVRSRQPLQISAIAAELSLEAAAISRQPDQITRLVIVPVVLLSRQPKQSTLIVADHDPDLAAFTAFMISLAEASDMLEEA